MKYSCNACGRYVDAGSGHDCYRSTSPNEPMVLQSVAVEWQRRAELAEAEVRRRDAENCETCRHQSKGDGLKVCWHSPIKCTGPYKSIDLTHFPKCETFGFTCGAWAAKETS